MTNHKRPAWPWPGDTPTERARRIARTYRDALATHAPNLCSTLDQHAADLGQTWITPQPLSLTDHDLLTATELADICHTSRNTIYQWRRRGLPVTTTPDGPRYRWADVLHYHAQRRQHRANTSKEANHDGH